jgi:hypothetical protein
VIRLAHRNRTLAHSKHRREEQEGSLGECTNTDLGNRSDPIGLSVRKRMLAHTDASPGCRLVWRRGVV